MNDIDTSRFLSLVLRHRPDKIGITLDPDGWTRVDALLAALARAGKPVDRQMLDRVVATNNKKRFALSEDGERIRASQGHSVQVELGYEPATPPAELFHGTVDRFLGAIRSEGLRPMKRHHVHLSADLATASNVGSRRGDAVVLTVRAADMRLAGHIFFVSANGVWLTDSVPPAFIDFPPGV